MTPHPVPLDAVAAFRAAFNADPENRLRVNAVTRSGIDAAGLVRDAAARAPNVFSHELKAGEVTAQNQSGRCWIFAACNVMRVEVMKRCDLDDFELSQAYLFFWDKFEKANYLLESILDTLDEPLGSRLLAWLLQAPFADGGQWDMAVALVEKYGAAPKAAYPESFHSGASARLNKFLTLKGREYARELRDAHRAGATLDELRRRKTAMLEVFYRMLCVALGTPPERFDFEVRGKERKDAAAANSVTANSGGGGAGNTAGDTAPNADTPKGVHAGRFTRDLNITPREFYKKYVGTALGDYLSLINAPTADKPFYKTYTVAYLGNVAGGRPVKYLNLPSSSLRRAALAQLRSNEVVWFGSDVRQMLDADGGLMAMDTLDLEAVFGTTFPLDKAARLDYGESRMTHAMVFTGVNEVDGVPNRWKVENSWGDARGLKGWFRMSDAWFDEYVYQVVVNKKFLTPEERAAWDLEPRVLEPWDPMGSLAGGGDAAP